MRMAFSWPPKTGWKTKESISQILWVLKEEGPIEDDHATSVLVDRLAAHGVDTAPNHIQAFRLLLKQMEDGRYGGLIERKIKGKRTLGIYLRAVELPENYLPDRPRDDEDVVELELFETETPDPAPPVEAAEPEPAPSNPDTGSGEYDLIAAGLAAELAELRTATAAAPTQTRVTERDLTDKDEIVRVVIELVGKLGSLISSEQTETMPAETLTRLSEAIERAERFRRRSLEAEETAEARRNETLALRRQIADRDSKIARLEANIEALLRGEQVNGQNLGRVERFIAERPHDRRGEASLAR